MIDEQISTALAFKRSLEHDFQIASGLEDRAYFSATYSLPQRSPLMWLNLNPGGTPLDYRILSDEQLAKGKHEFWHGYGKTSRATGAFLERIFNVPPMQLRSVQGTNVAWERSRTSSDMKLKDSAKRSAPFLKRYLQYASPDMLIFGGSAAFELFQGALRARVEEEHEVLKGNWGPHQARIFVAATLLIPNLGSFETIVVSHPSRGIREDVLERCQARLGGMKLPPALA